MKNHCKSQLYILMQYSHLFCKSLNKIKRNSYILENTTFLLAKVMFKNFEANAFQVKVGNLIFSINRLLNEPTKEFLSAFLLTRRRCCINVALNRDILGIGVSIAMIVIPTTLFPRRCNEITSDLFRTL